MHVIDLKTGTNGIRFSIAGRMAVEILKHQQANESCLPQDLNKRGFTQNEVLNNWNAAHFLIAVDNLDTWEGNNHG